MKRMDYKSVRDAVREELLPMKLANERTNEMRNYILQ